MNPFYRPADGWTADVIPFYEEGVFHLFYLKDYRDWENHGEGTPWHHLTTSDFVDFTDHGEALARGGKEEQDLYVFTGCVFKGEGQYHIFYTGHNPHLRRAGKPEQAVMHAVSDDLFTWTKVPKDTFFAPAGYEPHDWRDPFVFWNEEAGEYWMLLAARTQEGPSRRRGCTAVVASSDLKQWDLRQPLYAPALHFTHECPDLFRIGDWWYLVYSEFSETVRTRYCMSRSLAGPWMSPSNDTFDGRAWYAAKSTANDDGRRYIFGWNPTRKEQTDSSHWQWGGNLVTHELVQQVDGTLTVRLPESVSEHYAQTGDLVPDSSVGIWETAGESLCCDAPAGYAAQALGDTPDDGKITVRIKWSAGTRGCGIFLRGSDDFEESYYIRVEPHLQRLVFDTWPRPGDQPHFVELERPLLTSEREWHDLTVLISGSLCVAYLDDTIAMNARMYNRSSGTWGVFVQQGCAEFASSSVTLPA